MLFRLAFFFHYMDSAYYRELWEISREPSQFKQLSQIYWNSSFSLEYNQQTSLDARGNANEVIFSETFVPLSWTSHQRNYISPDIMGVDLAQDQTGPCILVWTAVAFSKVSLNVQIPQFWPIPSTQTGAPPPPNWTALEDPFYSCELLFSGAYGATMGEGKQRGWNLWEIRMILNHFSGATDTSTFIRTPTQRLSL